MINFKSSVVVLTLALGAMGIQAAQPDAHHPAVNVAAGEHLNPKIDAWASGTITAIDAKAGKFTIRGTKSPYATEYAKMMSDIFNKTQNLTGAERQTKENDIRHSYADNLAKARGQTPDKESDFTFNLPKENDGRLMIFGERGTQAAATNGKLSGNMMALTDLKIGDQVTVGYDAGTINNYGYAVIHGHASDEQLTALMETEPENRAK